MDIVTKAKKFAQKKHKSQKDNEGRPYFFHLNQVANILSQITSDKEIIAAGFLHDILEDTDTSEDELSNIFGDRITSIVRALTQLDNQETYGYIMPRLTPSVENRDAILVKFADRLSNLSRMESWNDSQKNAYIKKSAFWKTSK